MIAVISSGNTLTATASGSALTATASSTGLSAEFYSGWDGGNMQYRYFTDGTSSFREGVRSGKFVLDKTLTDTGFSGTEDTDWENLEKSS